MKARTAEQLDRARAGLTELRRRLEPRQRLAGLYGRHTAQDAFVADEGPIVLASAGRRGGKSMGVARKIVTRGLEFPQAFGLYVVQSRETAKGIIWPALRRVADQIGLELEFKEHTGDVVFPNGYRLLLRGGGTVREIDKYRGIAYPNVHVDEAQLFGESLRYLVQEVVEPSFLDYGDRAQLTLTGTPNAAKAGPFHDMIFGDVEGPPAGPHYRWTALDNPFLPNPAAFLERKRRQYGGETPAFKREYLGEWVREDGAMVFRFRPEINLVDTFERGEIDDWQFHLGVDLGYNDPTAFVVLAASQAAKRAVVVESFEETELIGPDVAVYVDELRESYDFASIVGDSGGYGKNIVEELNRVYNIAMKPAKKTYKPATIQTLNDAFATGALTIARDGNPTLPEQLRLLQWDPEHLKKNRFVVKDRRYPDHLADAMVYAFRDAYPYNEDDVRDPPTKHSRDWWRQEEARLIAQEEARVLEREREAGNPEAWFA